jgi:hypothetical protein
MYASHPGIAKRWQEHTPKGKDLPERVKKSVASLAAGLRGEELLPDPAKFEERSAAFKVGFLRKLAELGVTPNEFYDLVKVAVGDDALSSMFMGATDVGKSLIGTGLDWAGEAAKTLGTVALAAPVAIGAATGALSGALNSPSVEDINVLRKTEALELYKRMTQEINARRARKAMGAA